MSDTAGDRELLELAAKAAGMSVCTSADWGSGEWCWNEDGLLFARDGREWAPLTEPGDAMRLAMGLRMVIDCDDGEVSHPAAGVHYFGVDSIKSLCLAITRAAAAIARATQQGDAA